MFEEQLEAREPGVEWPQQRGAEESREGERCTVLCTAVCCYPWTPKELMDRAHGILEHEWPKKKKKKGTPLFSLTFNEIQHECMKFSIHFNYDCRQKSHL